MGAETPFRAGFVAIVGRPNVGKSTLLNRILGQKISITAHRPQTTRHRILGIKTEAGYQAVFVDTPGLHLGGRRAINRYLNRAASASLRDVDVVVFVVEGTRWTEEDEHVLEQLRRLHVPVLLAINKVDKVKDKPALLPHMAALAEKMDFREIIPLSARSGEGVDVLERRVVALLPRARHHYFDPHQVTDRSERFLAAELVREKLIRNLGQEVPHALTVEIERFEQRRGLRRISALIWVERPGHKPIVIGHGGQRLKRVGQQARKDMERLFGGRVHLELWVKVRQGWTDDERALRSLGYVDD